MPIRIDRPSNPVPEVKLKAGQAPVDKTYWDQLLALFPAEVTAIYLAGTNMIPDDQIVMMGIWLLFGVVATVVLKGEQLKAHPVAPDVSIPLDKSHITVAVISFLIWAYALGGVFALVGWSVKWVAGLLILAWVFSAPRLLPFFDGIFVPRKK